MTSIASLNDNQAHLVVAIAHSRFVRRSMFVPKSIYERLPQFWLLLGLLFMSSGTYLGFDYSLSFFYFGVGFACCLWSMWIFTKRLANRVIPRESEQLAEAAARDSDENQDQVVEPVAG